MTEIQSRIGDIIQRFEPGKPQAAAPAPSNPQSGTPRLFDREVDQIIREQAQRHGVSERLVRAVVQNESAGNPRARSRAGALGLMQLMPETARGLGVDPMDPEQNVDGGIRYLKQLSGQFDNLDDVLAAYNAGPGAVQRHRGVPPYRETRDYIDRIKRTLAEWDA